MGEGRKIWSVRGNSQRLDGGAMFGNCPRALWQRWIPPDEHNRIPLACRALLLADGDRLILFEAGIGAFFEPKMRERFGVQESHHVLIDSLAELGHGDADIDVVVLSHLHFDHAGGLLDVYRPGQELRLLFPNARFVVAEKAWQRATGPHPRDRASFIPQLQPLLQETGRLELVGDGQISETLGPELVLHFSDGHTPGLMLAEIPSASGPVVFAGDLIPGKPWMHLPITMGYDRYPELIIDEKKRLLDDLLSRGGRLFFTHDSETALTGIARDERGRYGPSEIREMVLGLAL